ncbi:hypothetical protein AXG93_2522s1000 [Marchantia polymorpha subsp. ruderalis]|uniref:Uncharacterized protein n=1 Tax=Marchantia polymorpha subsp. ruderalis TaxID=1480154 RepID=A0A176WGE0_MARPO|nr:hypothetical protein AXG93_2522s1000 [Marchantia polymorpha subsp. ruderalis]
MEFRRAEELSASLSAGYKKHEEDLADWAKKLVDCESARFSEVEFRKGRVEIAKVAKETGEGRGGLPSATGGVNRRVEVAVGEVSERICNVGIANSEVVEA